MERVGPFRILGKLGEGGMGVVYSARDERTGAAVALKLIRAAVDDEEARRRFDREARLAAAFVHPNVCRLLDVGEDAGAPFLVMELLEGETLAQRLARGSLEPGEAIAVGLAVLGALAALHTHGLVHRDLKPSNVFLAADGVKLLDFGLVRALPQVAGDRTESVLTQAGSLVGTPHYMSPEQMQGQSVDGRSDLFSSGAMLFEMLTGRKAFEGRSLAEVFHATLYDPSPALGGSPGVAGLDRVIRRALAKRPEDRYPGAAEMAGDLEAAGRSAQSGSAPRVVALTRLMVLPFRALRPDPDTDFLMVSLPDALSTSLSGLDALVVRSSIAAARFAGEHLDLARIATEAEVDVVLTGSLLRGGDQLRVTTQLVEAPAGTLLWSHATQAPVGDVFRLEDELVHRIVEALAVPLTAREHRQLKQDVPANARAYEFYLRANPLAQQPSGWHAACQLYEECLASDPRYAPAWARLGRVRRLLAKYDPEGAALNLRRAEEAFVRALELRPELPLAHGLYAQFEVEAGRPVDALRRLLLQAKLRSTDPELFAGLVHTCRYCGLLDASLAAHARAASLDPQAHTSVSFSHFARGEYQAAADVDATGILGARPYALACMGRTAEAVEALGKLSGKGSEWLAALALVLMGERRGALEMRRQLAHAGFRDPEGLYLVARGLVHVGLPEQGMQLLARAVEGGFFCEIALLGDPWLAPIRDWPGFGDLLGRARAATATAARLFAELGGGRLLGISA